MAAAWRRTRLIWQAGAETAKNYSAKKRVIKCENRERNIAGGAVFSENRQLAAAALW
jgi:hypothetical protein